VILQLDRLRLQQILISLIQNALKFSKANEHVIVRVKLIEMSGSSDVELQIKVIDTGVGIPKADLPNIFKPNFKSSESTVLNKNTYGNGLALSICQCIVSHLNGRITVKSKYGKGSTFKVVLKTLKVIYINFNRA
jgi:signal transduction histidine kinase